MWTKSPILCFCNSNCKIITNTHTKWNRNIFWHLSSLDIAQSAAAFFLACLCCVLSDNSYDKNRASGRLNNGIPMVPRRRSPSELDSFRCSLPVHEHQEEIIQIIKKNRVVLVLGETGSGKTTQVCLWTNRYSNTRFWHLSHVCFLHFLFIKMFKIHTENVDNAPVASGCNCS